MFVLVPRTGYETAVERIPEITKAYKTETTVVLLLKFDFDDPWWWLFLFFLMQIYNANS